MAFRKFLNDETYAVMPKVKTGGFLGNAADDSKHNQAIIRTLIGMIP